MTGIEIVLLGALFMFLADNGPLVSAECTITDTREKSPAELTKENTGKTY